MKFAHLLLFSLILLIGMSCSSDIGITEEIEEVEEPKTANEIEIQHISLQALNEILTANEIETFTRSFLEDNRKLRDEKPCLNAEFKGDLNGDDVISSDDILLLFELIKEYDNQDLYPETANNDGKLDVNKEYKGKSPSYWSVVYVAQLVNFDEGASNTTFLEKYDAAVIIDLLIGYCN